LFEPGARLACPPCWPLSLLLLWVGVLFCPCVRLIAAVSLATSPGIDNLSWRGLLLCFLVLLRWRCHRILLEPEVRREWWEEAGAAKPCDTHWSTTDLPQNMWRCITSGTSRRASARGRTTICRAKYHKHLMAAHHRTFSSGLVPA